MGFLDCSFEDYLSCHAIIAPNIEYPIIHTKSSQHSECARIPRIATNHLVVLLVQTSPTALYSLE